MKITVLVGEHQAAGKALARFVADNAVALSARGVATRRPRSADADFVVADVAPAWDSWLGSAKVSSQAHALLTETKLATPLLVQGQAIELTKVLRAHGTVGGAAFVRRMDDHVVAGYVNQLRAGRTAPLRGTDLQGRGNRYNYLARLEKWRSAMGTDSFDVRFCPSEAPVAELAQALLAIIGGPDAPPTAPPIVWPEDTTRAPLSADAAEAMRRLNARLVNEELSVDEQNERRYQAFDLLAQQSLGEPVLRLPAEAASALLERYRSPMVELAECMPTTDAERFLSLDTLDNPPRDDDRVTELISMVESAVGLRPLEPGSGPAEERVRLRPMVRRARRALAEGDEQKYRRTTRRLRRALEELPDAVLAGPATERGRSAIPHRVVQYWEPLPPPTEMEPWLASWGTVGMPDGEHRLMSYDDALAVLREAAGDNGATAFARAPHPAARADLFRYAELLLRGGWYVDAEHEALVAIPDVLSWPVDHVLVRRPGGGNIPNGFIGAVAGSSLLRTALDEACANVLEARGRNILELTGPGLFTRVVEAYLATPTASAVMLPTNAVFADVLQAVHNEADYKVRGHWRDHDLSVRDEP